MSNAEDLQKVGVNIDELMTTVNDLKGRMNNLETRVIALEDVPEVPTPDPEPEPIPDPVPSNFDIIKVGELTKNSVLSAWNGIKQDNTIIRLPPGTGWGADSLKLSSKFKNIYIMGEHFLDISAGHSELFKEAMADIRRANTRKSKVDKINLWISDFQPKTRNVSFELNSEGINLAQMEIVNLSINKAKGVVYLNRIISGVVVNETHVPELFRQNVHVDAGITAASRDAGFSNTQAAWESIPVSFNDENLLLVEESIIKAKSHAIDSTWQGGKILLRNSIITGGVGNRGLNRGHGLYLTPSKSRVNSCRLIMMVNVLNVNEQDIPWKCIDIYGGSALFYNVEDFAKAHGTINIGYEMTDVSTRPRPPNLSASALDPNKHPYEQQPGVPLGIWMHNLTDHGVPIISPSGKGFSLSAGAAKICKEGRDFHFGLPDWYVPIAKSSLFPKVI